MTLPAVCVLVGFFQDGVAGKRLAKNLQDLGIDSIWIDGRVEGFMAIDNSNLSTDGFKETLRNYSHVKHVHDFGLAPAGQSITWGFKCAAQMGYDYVIVMGCDEYLEGDFDLFRENLTRIKRNEPTRFRMPIEEHNPEHNHNAEHAQSRVISMPQYVYIKNIHWLYFHNFFGPDHPVIMAKHDNNPLVLGLTLHHDDTIRPAWRNNLMDIYQSKKTDEEWKIMEDMASQDSSQFGIKDGVKERFPDVP